MNMKSISIAAVMAVVLAFAGCIFPDPSNDPEPSTTKTNLVKKVALICNCTKVDKTKYDGWDGDCPGTDVDAANFANICKTMSIPYFRLENEKCTSSNLVKYWKECLSRLDPNDGLLVFYYSGHGGQVYQLTANEDDGLDETLCFWDGQIVDDDIWKLLNFVPKTARVFMVTDCCNSGTNFKVPYKKGIPFSMSVNVAKDLMARGQEPNLLHYGGCNDGEYSYGSNAGGVFTLALKSTFDKNASYKTWFDKCKKLMPAGSQVPTFAETGASFKDKHIFE